MRPFLHKNLTVVLHLYQGIQDKTKIIITTNQSYKNLDTALLRKGRLFNILEFRELTNEEALNIWLKNELPEETFKEKFKGDVLQAELGSIISMMKKTDNEVLPEYVLEEDISKLNKTEKKSIGV